MARSNKIRLIPGKPQKPQGLSKEASAMWDQVIGEFERSGVEFASAHRTLLEQAATLLADNADARETSEIEGLYFTHPRTGVRQMHAATRRLDALRRDCHRVMYLLGVGDMGHKKTIAELDLKQIDELIAGQRWLLDLQPPNAD